MVNSKKKKRGWRTGAAQKMRGGHRSRAGRRTNTLINFAYRTEPAFSSKKPASAFITRCCCSRVSTYSRMRLPASFHELTGLVDGFLRGGMFVVAVAGGGRGPRGAGWPRCENGERSGGGGGSCSRAVTRRGKRGQFFPGAENCGAGRDGVSGKSGQFSGRAAVGAFEWGRGCRQALTATGCPCVKVESLGLWRVRRSLLVFLGQNGDECCPKIHLKKN